MAIQLDFTPPNPIIDTDENIRYLIEQLREITRHIDAIEVVLPTLVIAGYGGMDLATPTAISLTGGGWVTVPFDAEEPAVPKGVTVNLGNETLTVDTAGLWRVNIGFNIEGHNEVASGGRTIFMRLYDVTAGTPGTSYPIGIGRNTADTDVNLGGLFQIAIAGNSIRLEIGGGDDVTGGTLVTANFQLNHVGELGSFLP
jgi:hypothetical protein